MRRNKLIPSSDVYTYYSQALDMLDTNHPHYQEIEQHLLGQIKDELADRYNTRPDSGAARTRKITDQSGTETAA